jgi:hypothetical protein
VGIATTATDQTGLQITNNTITADAGTPGAFNDASHGIFLNPDAARTTDVIISGNTITGSTLANGILIDTYGHVSITGNTFSRTPSAASSNFFAMIDLRSRTVATPLSNVTISGNTIDGGNRPNSIGVQLDDNGGTQPISNVLVEQNLIQHNTFGVVIGPFTNQQSQISATVRFNSITGNTTGMLLSSLTGAGSTAVDATDNWWGSNAGPGHPGSDTVSGPVNFDPWLVLQVTASPTAVAEGGVADVVASLTTNSAGTNTAALGHVPDGIPVSFGITLGTLVPSMGFTAGGEVVAQFTADNTPGTATVSAKVDNQTSTATITIEAPPPPVQRLDTIGAFDPVGEFGQPPATWYLRNSNSPGTPDFGPFSYGGPGWIPVAGDWNGDGVTTIGVVDPSTMTWYLRNSNSPGAPDIAPFQFGAPGDIPVVGDWTGQGFDTVGVFDPIARFGHPAGTWYLRNSNSSGAPDIAPFQYGAADFVPVVGDWTGKGVTTIGVFDPVGEFGQPAATWYLRNSNGAGAPDVGPFQYGAAGWKPVVGDWDANGTTTVGVFDPVGQFGQMPATWYLRNSNSPGAPDVGPFQYGAAGWVPVAGIWKDPPRPLHVLGGAVPGGPPVNPLTQDVAGALEAQAVARLQQDGVSAAVVARLAAVQVGIGEVGPGVLATADPQSGQVLLNPSAAGHGWFVDPTPLRDEEFVAAAAGQPQAAAPGGAADGRADLLTALMQEMGVAAGLEDPILTSALAPGTRNVAALDAYFATL